MAVPRPGWGQLDELERCLGLKRVRELTDSQLAAAIAARLLTRPADAWVETLTAAGISAQRRIGLAELMSDPELRSRGLTVAVPVESGTAIMPSVSPPRADPDAGRGRRRPSGVGRCRLDNRARRGRVGQPSGRRLGFAGPRSAACLVRRPVGDERGITSRNAIRIVWPCDTAIEHRGSPEPLHGLRKDQ
jgi:CoA-transferase family III